MKKEKQFDLGWGRVTVKIVSNISGSVFSAIYPYRVVTEYQIRDPGQPYKTFNNALLDFCTKCQIWENMAKEEHQDTGGS